MAVKELNVWKLFDKCMLYYKWRDNMMEVMIKSNFTDN